MKNFHNLENKKLMLKLEKPHLLHILSNNKIHYKLNSLNTQNKYNNHNTSLSPFLMGRNNKLSNNNNNLNQIVNNKFNQSPTKTYNYMKDTCNNNIIRTTPLKYQYKKIPFERVKGFKLKLPNSILNNKRSNNNIVNKKNNLNTQQNYYPIIKVHNHSTIQNNNFSKKEKPNRSSYSNLNYNNYYKKNTINNNTINNTINTKQASTNANSNYNTINEKNNLNYENNRNNTEKKIILYNESKKPLYQLMETKSSSMGSKLETREGSGNYLNKSRSKSSINFLQSINNNNKNNFKQKNFSFLKFEHKNHGLKLSSKKKILKYLDKTIRQLTKIKTIILDEQEYDDYNEDKEKNYINNGNEEEKIKKEIKNKFVKLDLEKIGKTLDKYKNKIDIDKNTINISLERNNDEASPYNFTGLNKKGNKQSLKKLNRTITYDDLKYNVKENQKLLNITQKSFKNFKKLNVHRRYKSDKNYKFDTISENNGEYYINNYKGISKKNERNNYKIKNYDTEILIPKLNINYNNKNINHENELKKINEELKYLNNQSKMQEEYNMNNDNDINADIANFEFSD